MNLFQGENTQREALAEECDFGGRESKLGSGEGTNAGARGDKGEDRVCPQWYLLQSPVVDLASCLQRVPPLPSLLLWLFPFSSFIGDQLTVWAQTSFLGRHCNYGAASGGSWRYSQM